MHAFLDLEHLSFHILSTYSIFFIYFDTGISVRSAEFYRREQDAVKAAMDVREQIVSESGIL